MAHRVDMTDDSMKRKESEREEKKKHDRVKKQCGEGRRGKNVM